MIEAWKVPPKWLDKTPDPSVYENIPQEWVVEDQWVNIGMVSTKAQPKYLWPGIHDVYAKNGDDANERLKVFEDCGMSHDQAITVMCREISASIQTIQVEA